MSLVNGVLADLDQRQAANARGADADWLSGLQAAALSSPGRVSQRHAKLVVLVLLGGLIAFALGSPRWVAPLADKELAAPVLVRTLELPSPPPRSIDAPVASPAPVLADQTNPAPAPQPREASRVEPIVLTDLDVIEVEDDTTIELALSAAPEYTLRTLTMPDRTVLELRNSQLNPSGLSHRARDDSLVSGVATSLDADDTLRLVFQQRRPARLQSATLRKDDDNYRLAINLASAPLTPTSTELDEAHATVALVNPLPQSPEPISTSQPEGGEMEKVPHKAAAVTPASESYLEAVDLYRRGRAAVAERRLRTALAHDPNHVESRLFLATLLIEQRRATEAQTLLADGLALLPRDPRMAKLAARLLVSAGEVEPALEVLLKASPAVTADPDYHAFVAAVLQRLELHREAIRLYQAVLALDPSQAAWWVGLAVSLEAEHKGDGALTAYRRAQVAQVMEPNLRRYIDSRISVLQRRKNP